MKAQAIYPGPTGTEISRHPGNEKPTHPKTKQPAVGSGLFWNPGFVSAVIQAYWEEDGAFRLEPRFCATEECLMVVRCFCPSLIWQWGLNFRRSCKRKRPGPHVLKRPGSRKSRRSLKKWSFHHIRIQNPCFCNRPPAIMATPSPTTKCFWNEWT